MTQDSAPLHGELAESENHKHRIEPMHNSRTKRKRRDSGEKFFWGELVSSLVLDDTNSIHDLSLSGLLNAILDSYFSQVHPWLPILHEITFRQQMLQQVYDPNLEVILRAIIYAAVRFVNFQDTSLTLDRIEKVTKNSRDWVMLHALNSLSLGNLQALLIISFDDVSFYPPEFESRTSDEKRLGQVRRQMYGQWWGHLLARWSTYN
jgi:hypothetical protein